MFVLFSKASEHANFIIGVLMDFVNQLLGSESVMASHPCPAMLEHES